MIYAQPTLLITDDDRSVRETLGQTFERYGFHTRLAADGEAAVRLFREREVHIVLMDMHMPRISGLEAVRQLRDHQSNLPCILISGAVTDEIQRRADEIGIFSVIPKPLNFTSTLESVWDALQSAYDWPVPHEYALKSTAS